MLVISIVYEDTRPWLPAPAELSLLLLELLPLELQRLLLSTEDVQGYCERYRRDNKRHQRDYGNHPGRLSGHLIPVRHPKEATDRPAMKIGRLPLATGLAAPLAVTNPATATGPTAGRGVINGRASLYTPPRGATRWDGCEPVRLRRAIVVMMSGHGQAVRDITLLQQVGEGTTCGMFICAG